MNFVELFSCYSPVTSSVLSFLDFKDTFALSHACRAVRQNVLANPNSFAYLDFRDKAALDALERVKQRDKQLVIKPLRFSSTAEFHRRLVEACNFYATNLSHCDHYSCILGSSELLGFAKHVKVLKIDCLKLQGSFRIKHLMLAIEPTIQELSLTSLNVPFITVANIIMDENLSWHKLKFLSLYGLGGLHQIGLAPSTRWTRLLSTLLALKTKAATNGFSLDIDICQWCPANDCKSHVAYLRDKTCARCGEQSSDFCCDASESELHCEFCGSYYCEKCITSTESFYLPGAEIKKTTSICVPCYELEMNKCARCVSGVLLTTGHGESGLRPTGDNESPTSCHICKRIYCPPCSKYNFHCDNCWNSECLTCRVEIARKTYTELGCTPMTLPGLVDDKGNVTDEFEEAVEVLSGALYQKCWKELVEDRWQQNSQDPSEGNTYELVMTDMIIVALVNKICETCDQELCIECETKTPGPEDWSEVQRAHPFLMDCRNCKRHKFFYQEVVDVDCDSDTEYSDDSDEFTDYNSSGDEDVSA